MQPTSPYKQRHPLAQEVEEGKNAGGHHKECCFSWIRHDAKEWVHPEIRCICNPHDPAKIIKGQDFFGFFSKAAAKLQGQGGVMDASTPPHMPQMSA